MLGRGEGRGGGGRDEESSKTKKERKQKIIEDLSQAEAGLLRHSMLIEE